jgi:hypothetical protein
VQRVEMPWRRTPWHTWVIAASYTVCGSGHRVLIEPFSGTAHGAST